MGIIKLKGMLTLISENERENKCFLKYSNVCTIKICIYMENSGNNISGNPIIKVLCAKSMDKCL